MIYKTYDNFYKQAGDLRGVFDERFQDPLNTHSDRFVWDYWHVPSEYTLLRTPAYHYFPKTLYQHFHSELVQFGRRVFGCHDISPPWLSCYIEGCKQEPHKDVPHGPLAFVYSLSSKKPVFSGGQTVIHTKPKIEIEPKFNRLTVFNPSLTHSVKTVKGTTDPREGRLVVHGWFVNPRPFWTGSLKQQQIERVLSDQFDPLLNEIKLSHGLLTLRLDIEPSGQVGKAQVLIDCLAKSSPKIQRQLLRAGLMLSFPKMKSKSQLTLPLMVVAN